MKPSHREQLEVALAARKPIDDAPRQPLEVELLLNESQRVSVNQHKAFRDSIKPEPQEPFDEIDQAIDEMIQIDPYAGDPPNRRSDKETSRLLSILDSLKTERGNH